MCSSEIHRRCPAAQLSLAALFPERVFFSSPAALKGRQGLPDGEDQVAFENLSRSLLNPGPGQANLEAQPGLAPPPWAPHREPGLVSGPRLGQPVQRGGEGGGEAGRPGSRRWVRGAGPRGAAVNAPIFSQRMGSMCGWGLGQGGAPSPSQMTQAFPHPWALQDPLLPAGTPLSTSPECSCRGGRKEGL